MKRTPTTAKVPKLIIRRLDTWFSMKRPSQWTRAQHLDHPTVNWQTAAEMELALAYASFIRRRTRLAARRKGRNA